MGRGGGGEWCGMVWVVWGGDGAIGVTCFHCVVCAGEVGGNVDAIMLWLLVWR